MIFLNQNNTTNAEILHYSINNNPYLCQSTQSAYHINSYITRPKILKVLPNSARVTVHTRTDQIMDTRAASDCLGDLHARKTNIYLTNITFIHCYPCMINYYGDFALYKAGVCYLYSITRIPIGDAITIL